jgi:hypothetical protein
MEPGQYRFAVASGESQPTQNLMMIETDPTLPRIGTYRFRNLIVWLRPMPRCATRGSRCVCSGWP